MRRIPDTRPIRPWTAVCGPLTVAVLAMVLGNSCRTLQPCDSLHEDSTATVTTPSGLVHGLSVSNRLPCENEDIEIEAFAKNGSLSTQQVRVFACSLALGGSLTVQVTPGTSACDAQPYNASIAPGESLATGGAFVRVKSLVGDYDLRIALGVDTVMVSLPVQVRR